MNGIAISGKAGAGKNALATELSLRLLSRGLWPVEMGFAEGPKAELLALTGLRKEDPGGREALVQLAHTRRLEDPLYWVRKTAARVNSLMLLGGVPIITDMRYLNELSWAESACFVTVRVEATRADRMAALASRGEDPSFVDSEHPSECELDEGRFEFRFLNPHDDSTRELGRWAFRIVEVLADEIDWPGLDSKRGESREALPKVAARVRTAVV